MYRRCEQMSDESLKKIFDDVCESDPEAASQIPSYSVRRTLRQKRALCRPAESNRANIRRAQRRTHLSSERRDERSESIYEIPEDDYGHLYQGVNISDEVVPYYPVQTNISANRRLGRACVICLCAEADQLVRPCKHLCLCTDCLYTAENDVYSEYKKLNECPMCKGEISEFEKIYLP